MDDVRAVAGEMRAAEDTLLTQRAAQARLARRSALAFGVASLLVALALAVVAVSVERNFERRHLILTKETQARAEAERQALAAALTLQQIETFNKNILDHSGDCIQVLEPDGRVVLVNRPGLALLEVDTRMALWATTGRPPGTTTRGSRGRQSTTRSPKARDGSTRFGQPSKAHRSGGM